MLLMLQSRQGCAPVPMLQGIAQKGKRGIQKGRDAEVACQVSAQVLCRETWCKAVAHHVLLSGFRVSCWHYGFAFLLPARVLPNQGLLARLPARNACAELCAACPFQALQPGRCSQACECNPACSLLPRHPSGRLLCRWGSSTLSFWPGKCESFQKQS